MDETSMEDILDNMMEDPVDYGHLIDDMNPPRDTGFDEENPINVINLDGEDETEKGSDETEVEAAKENEVEDDNPFEKKPRAKTSSVWDDFQVVKEPDSTKKAQCVHCKKKMKIQPSGVTTSFARHRDGCLKRKLYLRNQKMLNFKPAKSKVALMPLVVTSGKYDHAKQREAVAHWILMNEKPFKIVEELGFNFMIGMNLPMHEKISRTQARKDCFSVYEREKKKLKMMLKSVNVVSLTTDVWKSDVQKKSYICMTGHFIDSDWILQKRLLNFVQFPPPHSGLEIADTLRKCVSDWGIESKVFTISVDNAPCNDVAIRIMKQAFSKSRKLPLGGILFHVRCCAHILNLIVQDGLSEIVRIIHNVRETVKYLNVTESRLIKFGGIVHQMGLRARQLILDCTTRWNSTYDMLMCAYEVRDVFPVFAQLELTYKNCPSEEDWVRVKQVTKILEVFYEATQMISGTDYPTSNKFLPVIWRVKEVLNEGGKDVSEFVRDMVAKMKEKFDKYWGECNMLISIASVLDPRCKMRLVEFSFNIIYSEPEAKANIFKVKSMLTALFDEYTVPNQSSSSNSQSPLTETSSGTSVQLSGVDVPESSGWSRFDSYVKSVENEPPEKSELQVYLEDGILRSDGPNSNAKFDILDWWKKNNSKYKILSRMACDILAIPATTVASESTFSAGSRVIDPYRAALAADTVEMQMCGGDWIRRIHGITERPSNIEDEPVVIEIPMPSS